MILFKFDNTFDNVVTEDRGFDVEWSDLVELFSVHQESEDKNTHGFIAAEFDLSETARPATKKIYAADGATLVAEIVKTDAAGKPLVGRLSENITFIHAICLDSDTGWEISEAKELLKGICHLGYTSWSHGAEGKGTRFRVILPLKTPCPSAEWSRRHHAIQEMFPHVDASFTAKGRVMFAPTCPTERLHLSETWSEVGELIDWQDFDAKEEQVFVANPNRQALVKTGYGKIVYETFDMVQFMKDEGLYIKSTGGSQHQVICPNVNAHTGGATSGTVMWQSGSGWPSFHCSHGHCSNFKFFDHFKNIRGKGWMSNYCEREATPISLTAELNMLSAKYRKN